METIKTISSRLCRRPSMLEGIARIFDFSGSLQKSEILENTCNNTDALALSEDWRIVGADMHQALDAYEKRKRNTRQVATTDGVRDAVHSVVLREERLQHFSGPLPHPSVLEKYDAIVPGAGERILLMAEQQAKHRQQLEQKITDSDIARSKLGQVFGFAIAVCGLLVSGFMAYVGRETSASIIGGATLASLVGIFVYGKHLQEKDVVEKNSRG